MKKRMAGIAHTLQSNLYSLVFCWRNAKGLFFANLFDILFGGLFDPVYLLVTAAPFHELEIQGAFIDALKVIGIMAAMLAVRIAWSQLYNTVLKPLLSEKLQAKVQKQLFDKSVQMELERYDDPEFYDSFIMAMGNTGSFAMGAMSNLSAVIKFTFTIIAMVGVLSYVDVTAMLIIVASTVLSAVFTSRIRKISFEREQALIPTSKRASYISRVFRLREHAALLRLSGMGKVLTDDYDDNTRQAAEVEKKYGKRKFLWSMLSGLNGDSVYMSVIILVLYRVIVVGSVALSQFVIVVSANWRFREALEEFVGAVSSLPEQSMHMDKVRMFINYQPVTPAGKAVPPQFESFEMRNVSFGYGDGEDVLKDVSFRFQRGEKTALVGENGAGKSTLIKLMLGLYTPRSGTVLYNGVDIREFDPRLYRERFGVVFQDYAVYAQSVYDNVACGAAGEEAESRFTQAIEFADLRSKVEGLAHGADTVLSREFDDEGVNLSGGEQQKVAIARARFKQADIMVMDEPSSALDPLAEARIKGHVFAGDKDQTVFIISHRLSTTRDASRILVLANGRIIESGVHDELMKIDGRYAEAFLAQAKRYKSPAIGTEA